jgi:hypothetical protein
MPQRIERLRTARCPGLALALNVLCGGLPATTAYIQFLSCAALDFCHDHPMTGLCRDYPVELKVSVAQLSEKSNHRKRLNRVTGLYLTAKADGFYALSYK